MRVFTILMMLGTLMTTALHLAADEIYRSVDAEGNVTFTDSPEAGDRSAEKMEILPGPSPSSIEESKLRQQEIRRAADQAQRKRLDQLQGESEQLSEARKALAEAEARLAEAKVIKDEDRQNVVGGKRRINPAYFERIKAAEAEVKAARKRLREARGY